ncbi:MAG: efflux RND transporter periplasmic adaptor subunit [Pseudomonadales bacterium]
MNVEKTGTGLRGGRIATFAVVLIMGVVIGYLAGPGEVSDPATGPDTGVQPAPAAQAQREILYWKAPMDPNYRRDRPGKSPMGMDLVPVYADEANKAGGADNLVRIDPAVTASLGIRTGVAQFGPLQRQLHSVGYIGFDEDTLHHIHVRVEGWIEALTVHSIGDAVRRGQTLFEIYSPTLVNAQEEFLAAQRSSNAALREASGARLRAFGVSEAEIARLGRDRNVRQRVPVIAPADGVVTALGARHGMYITPMTEVISIAGIDQVWLLAEIFERQSSWVQAGAPVVVEIESIPDRQWRGRVDYVYPELDAKTRTLRARVGLDNSDGVLRPNLFARVAIDTPATAPVVHVPAEAVIRGERVSRVVVDLGGGRYQVRSVELGIESADRVAILKGISADESVVVSGQFLIDSESNAGSALGRMSDHAHQGSSISDHSRHQP